MNEKRVITRGERKKNCVRIVDRIILRSELSGSRDNSANFAFDSNERNHSANAKFNA